MTSETVGLLLVCYCDHCHCCSVTVSNSSRSQLLGTRRQKPNLLHEHLHSSLQMFAHVMFALCFTYNHSSVCLTLVSLIGVAPGRCGLQDHVNVCGILRNSAGLCQLPSLPQSQPPLPSQGWSSFHTNMIWNCLVCFWKWKVCFQCPYLINSCPGAPHGAWFIFISQASQQNRSDHADYYLLVLP